MNNRLSNRALGALGILATAGMLWTFSAIGQTSSPNTQLTTQPIQAPGNPSDPRIIGGFSSRNAAFDAQPSNFGDYFLRREPNQTWSWVPNSMRTPQDDANMYKQLDDYAHSGTNMFSPDMQQRWR
jgi:hypothetical protein